MNYVIVVFFCFYLLFLTGMENITIVVIDCHGCRWCSLFGTEMKLDTFDLTHCGLVTHYVDLYITQLWQVMACYLDGTKPLPEPMLARDYWHPYQYNFIVNAHGILGEFISLKSSFLRLLCICQGKMSSSGLWCSKQHAMAVVDLKVIGDIYNLMK